MKLVRMTLDEILRRPIDPAETARLDAMSDAEVLRRAKADPDAQPVTDFYGWLRRPRVKALRQRFGLSQREFSRMFRIPLGTLRDWEQGRAEPEWTARILLATIARHPEAVVDALSGFVSKKEAARRRGAALALKRRARKAPARKLGAPARKAAA